MAEPQRPDDWTQGPVHDDERPRSRILEFLGRNPLVSGIIAGVVLLAGVFSANRLNSRNTEPKDRAADESISPSTGGGLLLDLDPQDDSLRQLREEATKEKIKEFRKGLEEELIKGLERKKQGLPPLEKEPEDSPITPDFSPVKRDFSDGLFDGEIYPKPDTGIPVEQGTPEKPKGEEGDTSAIEPGITEEATRWAKRQSELQGTIGIKTLRKRLDRELLSYPKDTILKDVDTELKKLEGIEKPSNDQVEKTLQKIREILSPTSEKDIQDLLKAHRDLLDLLRSLGSAPSHQVQDAAVASAPAKEAGQKRGG